MRGCYSGRIGKDLSLDVVDSVDLELRGLVTQSLDKDSQQGLTLMSQHTSTQESGFGSF